MAYSDQPSSLFATDTHIGNIADDLKCCFHDKMLPYRSEVLVYHY